MSDLVKRMRTHADGLNHGQVENAHGAMGALYEAVDRIEELEVQLAGWRDFLVKLSATDGGMVNGNYLSRAAKELLKANSR